MRWVLQERMRHARRRSDELFGLVTAAGLGEASDPSRSGIGPCSTSAAP
jgi:hypothetical protein